MIRTILASVAIALSTVPPSLAASPPAYLRSVSTVYGQFACMERAKNKLFAIGATSINGSSFNLWGNLSGAKIGIWCRGSEAIIFAAGENATSLVEEVAGVF